jgi:molybdate transport system permease protein
MSEFGATLVLAGNIPGETRTLSLALWTSLQNPGGDGQALRFLGIAIFLAVLSIALDQMLRRKSS